MELKNAVKMISSIETFANSININVSMDDLKVLSKVNPQISENIDFLKQWLADGIDFSTLKSVEEVSTTTKEPKKHPWELVAPDAEWRHVIDMNFMVSDKGDIWNLTTNELMHQYFRDGDLRITMGSDPARDTRRVAPIVSKAFQIWSPDKNGDYIIDYKDGDRRNMRVDNIYWKKPTGEYVDTRRYLIEDICRRIIEFEGVIEKIMPKYEGSRPSVSAASVHQIRDKKLYTEISDLFFVNNEGKIYPRTDAMAIDTNTNKAGVDISQFFMISGDRNITGSLLREKIKKGETLTLNEKVIVIFMAMDIIGMDKANDVRKISNVIKNSFGADIGLDFINQVRNDYTSEISEMFRGEVTTNE